MKRWNVIPNRLQRNTGLLIGVTFEHRHTTVFLRPMNSPSFIERIKLFLNGARLNAQPFARVSGNGPVSALCSDVDALPLHSDLNEFAQLYRAHQAFPERCPS